MDTDDLLVTRRHFFSRSALGLGSAALASLLNHASGAPAVSARRANVAARAKRVIYIFQAGGPPQMETYDYKPTLVAFDGQDVPPSVVGQQRLVFAKGGLRIVAPPYKFAQYGQSGAWVSELLPHMASIVDDLCFIKSMHTESINHDPGLTYMMTGSQTPGRPSMGAWTSYGLGSENENLPAFVVLLRGSKITDAATPISASHWGSGFLPSNHQGVRFRSGSDPVLYLGNPAGIDAEARRSMLDAGAELNRLQYQKVGDPEINTRIAQYEMAYRMQTSVPQLMDLSGESEHTFKMYGPESRTSGSYAANCLLARRLVESGVRFVQVFDRDWDHHRNIKKSMALKTAETDRPTAALLRDLKQRGLFEDTLVVCSGEFGRSVYCQGGKLEEGYGRDHHGACFTSWLAGAGVKSGASVGRSDDYCFNVAERPVHVHDFNATILHLLGIDHTRLTYSFQGRDYRLTDVHGKVVNEVLA